MDEELRRIRSEEALADSVYKSFPGQKLTRVGSQVEDDLSSEEQREADDRSALLGSVL